MPLLRHKLEKILYTPRYTFGLLLLLGLGDSSTSSNSSTPSNNISISAEISGM